MFSPLEVSDEYPPSTTLIVRGLPSNLVIFAVPPPPQYSVIRLQLSPYPGSSASLPDIATHQHRWHVNCIQTPTSETLHQSLHSLAMAPTMSSLWTQSFPTGAKFVEHDVPDLKRQSMLAPPNNQTRLIQLIVHTGVHSNRRNIRHRPPTRPHPLLQKRQSLPRSAQRARRHRTHHASRARIQRHPRIPPP